MADIVVISLIQKYLFLCHHSFFYYAIRLAKLFLRYFTVFITVGALRQSFTAYLLFPELKSFLKIAGYHTGVFLNTGRKVLFRRVYTTKSIFSSLNTGESANIVHVRYCMSISALVGSLREKGQFPKTCLEYKTRAQEEI